jgi:cytochrome c553
MRDLGAYFASQRRAARTVSDAALVDKGRALYRGGDTDTRASACIACHGPIGSGNPAASYPSLRGQYATYTARQLHAYASGTRKTDGSTKVMRDIAARLSDSDIVAVSSYIQGLRGTVTVAE